MKRYPHALLIFVSLSYSFFAFSQANVIVIMLDDARYDSYSCNGAPAVLQTPNIDRIANEGINFKYSFDTYALCNPSRTCFFTGLYPHNSGAIDDQTLFYSTLPTLAESLDTAGYYTALLGKYLNPLDDNPLPQPGWDYWMARYQGGVYDPSFMFNDSMLHQINGHITDIITDTAIRIIQTSAAPFFIMLNYATHPPYRPRPQEQNLFDGVTVPLPNNFSPYTENYPSFLYTSNQVADPPDTVEKNYQLYFDVLVGVDISIGRIFDALTAQGILNNTLILFTSDNGYMMGEHDLGGKRLPYEESIRIPVFARYPSWFPAGTVETNNMALNVDFTSTILDAAGIENAFPTDGISLHHLFDGSSTRTKFYYELTNALNSITSCRSVRSFDFKYNYYFCDSITEEFFDMNGDSAENDNLINTLFYQSLIQQYRNLKDSLKNALGDVLVEDVHNCSMANQVFDGSWDAETMEELNALHVYPNPVADHCTVQFPVALRHGGALVVRNNLGAVSNTYNLAPSSNNVKLDLNSYPNGIYFIEVYSGNRYWNAKVIISH